jgi:hypothetical protein
VNGLYCVLSDRPRSDGKSENVIEALAESVTCVLCNAAAAAASLLLLVVLELGDVFCFEFAELDPLTDGVYQPDDGKALMFIIFPL